MAFQPQFLKALVFALFIAIPHLSVAAPIRERKDKNDPLVAEMKFVRVPKGTFWMGGGRHEPPKKQVTIKEDFEIAAFTVTQEQWQTIMGNNPSHFSRKGGGKDKVKDIGEADLRRFPVEEVSWEDVQKFLKKLNEIQKGKGWLYRLPTEAEWEYACRNAATTKEDCSFDFYLDQPANNLSSFQANFNGSFPERGGVKGPYLGRTTKVGSYPPNKLGLYDMHGNIYQWCSDLWDGRRVVRGASWNLNAYDCRAGERRRVGPDNVLRGILGIRLVRTSVGN
jgi:formylglycine-generating enzyme required for sulfatase activity